MKKMNEHVLQVEELEERIAPDAVGNPGSNNTNKPGNEGTGGKVSTGRIDPPNPSSQANNGEG